MTHQYAGRYDQKHPPEASLDQETAERLRKVISEGKITCAAAHKIAGALNRSPGEIGVAIDLMNIRISKCQLGLFGYGPKKKKGSPTVGVPDRVKRAIENSLVDNRVSCLSCWEIARTLKISRMSIASACDRLQIKIFSCQLGSF